jgi:hypothetical protein
MICEHLSLLNKVSFAGKRIDWHVEDPLPRPNALTGTSKIPAKTKRSAARGQENALASKPSKKRKDAALSKKAGEPKRRGNIRHAFPP